MVLRRLSIVGVGALAGCILGVVAAALASPGFRATTTLLVQVHGAPAAVPTVATIARGDSVVGNVASAVHLSAGHIRRHLHVSVPPGTALVRLAYDDANRLKAVQIVQEEATVVQAIVSGRLGAVQASVVDPARATRRGRPFVRDALLGALLGVLLGAAGLAAGRVPRPSPSPAPVPVQEEARAPEPPPPPPPAPAVPVPAPTPAVQHVQTGRVAQLRALVAAHGAEHSPDQVAEWHGYLEAFATQEVDGALPPNLDGLARDVFAPLLERA